MARAFADAYLSMVFVQRFFHADPHPGNVFVEPDGRIAFVDFGMVGQVATSTRLGLGKVLLALVAVDVRQMADGLFDLGIARGESTAARSNATSTASCSATPSCPSKRSASARSSTT